MLLSVVYVLTASLLKQARFNYYYLPLVDVEILVTLYK